MFKLFQNLLPQEKSSPTSSEIATTGSNWSARITQADALWEQGKLSEALAIYGLAIEQNPEVPEIKQRLAARLKQQGDLAVAYEKLAVGLKNKGNIEQAANYYRQAINIKAMTGNTKKQLLRSKIVPTERSPIPLDSLKEAAFSFQPLANSAIVTAPTPPSIDNSEPEFNTSPQFAPRLKAINPKQAKDIDWETAQVYFQKALEHLDRQEWEQTALACKQATLIMPEMAEAYKIWGNALQRMGKTGEAMSCYSKAVEVKPNLAEVYAGIADIYSQQEKWEAAIKHYQKAIIIKPSAQIYRKLAAIWDRLREPDKVHLNIERARELEQSQSPPEPLDPSTIDSTKIKDSVAAYCRMAQQQERKDHWKQAAKYYRQALDLSMSQLALPAQSERQEAVPDNNSQAAKTVKIPPKQVPENQLDKAIRRYYKQSQLQPNSPRIHTDLGNLYAKKGQLQQAISCYLRAIRLNRKYAKAHLSLGRIMLKLGRRQEFIHEMRLALVSDPKIGTAMDRFYLGNALTDQRQNHQAIGFYYKAIAIEPQFLAPYHRLSKLLSQQGKYKEAIEFLEQGIEHNSQSPETYYLLAKQWEKLQHWENAVKTYSQVLQLAPQYPEALQKLNRALAEKIRTRQAVRQAKS